MRTIRILLAAAAALAVAAPAAQADSIAYIKGGDVWLSTGDGARQFQVTSRGGYADVSQADDGTMIALWGIRLHRLDRFGNLLADFDTPVSDSRPPGARTFYGPFDPAVSPDGTKVAYTWYYLTQSQNPTCFPPTCYTTINEGGTGYSHADRQTAWDEAGFRKHSGWRNPIWASDSTTMLSDPTRLPNADVVVDTPAERGEGGFLVRNWFSDTVGGNPHLGGGDVTRDHAKLAFTTGENDVSVSLYRMRGFPTVFGDGNADPSTYPEVCYRYSGAAGGRYGTPTFSPDGGRAAWSEADGIHVVTVPSFAAGCTVDGASPTAPLMIAGGSQPDWGPAEVPAARPNQGGGAPGSGSGAPTGGGSTGRPGRVVRIAVTPARLRHALRAGLRVRVSGAAPGRIRVLVRHGRRTVARGTATVGPSGRSNIQARFTAAARRALRSRARVTLTVSAAGATRRISLRR